MTADALVWVSGLRRLPIHTGGLSQGQSTMQNNTETKKNDVRVANRFFSSWTLSRLLCLSICMSNQRRNSRILLPLQTGSPLSSQPDRPSFKPLSKPVQAFADGSWRNTRVVAPKLCPHQTVVLSLQMCTLEPRSQIYKSR